MTEIAGLTAEALRGDLFHLCGPIIEPGAVLLPGNYGRILRLYGWCHGHAMREHALEKARETLAPHLPSRLGCAFCFLTLQEARAFRGEIVPGRQPQGFEGHLIYRVRLIEPEASWFVANYTLVSPPVFPGLLNANWPAMYWESLAPAVVAQDTVPIDGRAARTAAPGAHAVSQSGVAHGRVHSRAEFGQREVLTLSGLRVEERLDGL